MEHSCARGERGAASIASDPGGDPVAEVVGHGDRLVRGAVDDRDDGAARGAQIGRVVAPRDPVAEGQAPVPEAFDHEMYVDAIAHAARGAEVRLAVHRGQAQAAAAEDLGVRGAQALVEPGLHRLVEPVEDPGEVGDARGIAVAEANT